MKFIVEFPHKDSLTPDEQVFINLLLAKEYKSISLIISKNLLVVNIDHLISAGYILNWSDNPEEIIVSKEKNLSVAPIESWIDEYRNVFKDKKPGSMGSKKSCIEKMQKFIEEYPEYNDPKLIVSAAERYVNTQRISEFIYLQQADYFISKKDSLSTNSRLAAFCEEIINLKDRQEKFNRVGRQSI